MSCSRWHRLIALEVGGELDPRRSRSVENHLEGCTACRDLSEELRSQREQLLRLDRKAGGGVMLGSVRHAVLAGLADRRRPFLPFLRGGQRLAFAGAAAVVLVVAVVILRLGGVPPHRDVADRRVPTSIPVPATVPIPSPITEVIVEPPQATVPPAPAESVEREPLRLARSDMPTRGHETANSLSAPTEPMTVKILTDDPDVVIYWIVDPKGEKENA